jgi:hypothetical protein
MSIARHTTTDLNLPRRSGEALPRAYQGELDFHYIEEGSTLDMRWKRERWKREQ